MLFFLNGSNQALISSGKIRKFLLIAPWPENDAITLTQQMQDSGEWVVGSGGGGMRRILVQVSSAPVTRKLQR